MTTHSVPAAQSEPRAIGHQSRGVASNIQVRHLAFAVRLLFFTLAAVAIRRELAGVRHTDLLAGFQSYGAFQLAAALGFTAASFLALGSLELLTLRHYGGERSHAVRGPTALATAYVAHAFSQSAGFAILTGAAIRLRAYIRHGMDSVSVARLSAFITMIMTLGLLTLAGIAMLAASTMSVPRPAMRAGLAGTLFILPPLGYVAWSMFGRSSGIGRGAWRVPRPSPPLAAGQIVLSALDWLFAGLVLFLLLPSPLSVPYLSFLAAYMLAQAVGFVSQIPGGIGAFDATLLVLLSPLTAASELAVSLVMYRVIYYLLPLCGAIALLAFNEFRGRVRLTDERAPGTS